MGKQPCDEKWVKDTLGKIIARKCVAFLKDPANRADFEEWYLKRYGTPYQWKHL